MNNSNYVDYEDTKASSEHKSEYIRELQEKNRVLKGWNKALDGALDLVKEDEEKVRRKYKKLYWEKEQIEQQNKRYEEALKFYADEENYDTFEGADTIYEYDMQPPGQKARRALGIEETEET